MSQTVTAIYEDGVLRLLSPLDLSEHSRVRIVVQPEDPEEYRREVRRLFSEAG